jgi:hypothetical protein
MDTKTKKPRVRKPKEKPVFKIVVATPDAPIIVSFQ